MPTLQPALVLFLLACLSLALGYVPSVHEFLADLPGSMELEDTYQADVMRLHGVPEAAIAELYAVSKEHRIYGGSVTVDRTIKDGDVVEAGGRRLLVGERPGHSPTDTIFVS